ncbi:MAG: hypothetical protein ABJ042_01985 [Lentilitoribacter sp.]
MLKAKISDLDITTKFYKFPGSHILDSFRKHISETGIPTTWQYHNHTKPPADSEFEELLSFEIPSKLRDNVGKALCPICSPHSPKYFDGKLAWFPKEGVIRAIGHECAKTLFGTEATNRAKSARLARERKNSAEDYLLDKLPKIGELRNLVESLIPKGRQLDAVRVSIWKAGGKSACQNLVRLGAGGELKLYDEVKSIKADKFGETSTVFERVEIGSIQIRALNFLKNSSSIEAKAKNALVALVAINATNDEEEALEFITSTLTMDRFLFDAEKVTKAALVDVDELRKIIAEAKHFLNPTNLENLSRWAAHEGSNSPIVFKYNVSSPLKINIGIKSTDFYAGTKLISLPNYD